MIRNHELPPNYSGSMWLNGEEVEKFEKERKVTVVRGGVSPEVGDIIQLAAGENTLWGKAISIKKTSDGQTEIELQYVGD